MAPQAVFDLDRMVRFAPQGQGRTDAIGLSAPLSSNADFGGAGSPGWEPQLNLYPARVITEQIHDPASGVAGAPPNFGREMVPHIYTVQGRVGTISRVYRPADEALRNSLDDARYMRNECGIMECLEARQRGTCLLNWHLEPEDAKNQDQINLCKQLTGIIERIPHFLEYRRNLLEALWYGKYAVAHTWGMQKINGVFRKTITRWSPRHGDKLVFRYDDGSWAYDPSQVGIRVGAGYRTEDKGPDFLGGQRRKIEPTDQGLAYFLDAWEREKLIAIHQHIIEDGAYEDPLQAGAVTGVGIRSRIYWTWYQMQECLAFLLDYIERSALGVEIWRFPAGNPTAEARTRKAAEERIGGGRSIILVPVPQGDDSSLYDVQHIEPGMAGANAVRELIEQYFAHKIKRYILGQILTSEAEATGLGSGVADAHLGTYADIIRYDSTKLGETLTTDLVATIKAENFPRWKDCHVRFVIDTEEDDAEEKLAAYGKGYEMGLKIKADDVRNIIGSSKPDPDDEVLSIEQQQAGAGAFGGGQFLGAPALPPVPPQDQAKMAADLQENMRDDLSGYVDSPELAPEAVEQFAAREFSTEGRGGPQPFTHVTQTRDPSELYQREGFTYSVFDPGEYVVTTQGGKIRYERQGTLFPGVGEKQGKGSGQKRLWNEEDHPRDAGGQFTDKENEGAGAKEESRDHSTIRAEIDDLTQQLEDPDLSDLDQELLESDIRALEDELSAVDESGEKASDSTPEVEKPEGKGEKSQVDEPGRWTVEGFDETFHSKKEAEEFREQKRKEKIQELLAKDPTWDNDAMRPLLDNMVLDELQAHIDRAEQKNADKPNARGGEKDQKPEEKPESTTEQPAEQSNDAEQSSGTGEPEGVPKFESIEQAEKWLEQYTLSGQGDRFVRDKRLNRKHVQALQKDIDKAFPGEDIRLTTRKGGDVSISCRGLDDDTAQEVSDWLVEQGMVSTDSATQILEKSPAYKDGQPHWHTGRVGQGSWTGATVDIKGMKPEQAQDLAEGLHAVLGDFGDDKFKLKNVGWSQKSVKAIAFYQHSGPWSSARDPGLIGLSKKGFKTVNDAYVQKTQRYVEASNTVALRRKQEMVDSWADKPDSTTKDHVKLGLEKQKAIKRWTFAEDTGSASGYRKAVAAHEAGHAIYYQGKVYGSSGDHVSTAFESALAQQYGLSDTVNARRSLAGSDEFQVDQYRVSEYAATNTSELWAEVTAAKAVGMESEVPPQILAAYDEVRAKIRA
jgi:phage gp29-like protein